VLYSVGANAHHGLRRTNADKRRAVEMLLRDEEWRGWSDREIARRCAVTHPFVGKIRDELSLVTITSEIRHGADGRTINTANIGKRLDPTPEPEPFIQSDMVTFATPFSTALGEVADQFTELAVTMNNDDNPSCMS
jgi:hypothetical protein